MNLQESTPLSYKTEFKIAANPGPGYLNFTLNNPAQKKIHPNPAPLQEKST